MRFVTFGLALLSAGSVIAAAVLVSAGGWRIVAGGAVVALVGLLVALSSELASEAISRRTGAVLRHGAVDARRPGPLAARLGALVAGVLPMAAMVAFQITVYRVLPHRAPCRWLFGYGVATGPWTLLAAMTRLEIQNLRGVHAYTGQIAYLAFTFATDGLDLSAWAATLLMAVVALPPAIVGTLLARTDLAMLPTVPRTRLARLRTKR